ncbi:hypothetical protein E2C01_017152 [Portunus trituberculatus]|uniref:Uncharacterized protein n=1 Tax=Portunus trituberculatus TaxID=210409 RepID=A0A5B7DR53_PORTR|nr:hypothetical protein [Portunus trituberculatus]
MCESQLRVDYKWAGVTAWPTPARGVQAGVLAQQEAVVVAGKARSSGTRKEEEARKGSGTTHTPAVNGATDITLLRPNTAPNHDST